MPKLDYIQVDKNSTIMCSALEDLARRAGILSKSDCSTEFIEALHSLRMNLLNVSKMIKEGKTWK